MYVNEYEYSISGSTLLCKVPRIREVSYSYSMKVGTASARCCAIEKTAKILSDKWTMLIMRDVLEGPARFCELERSLSGISTRTLTLKLTKLIEEEMIIKNEDGYYETTPKGRGLRAVENAMRTYGEKYL